MIVHIPAGSVSTTIAKNVHLNATSFLTLIGEEDAGLTSLLLTPKLPMLPPVAQQHIPFAITKERAAEARKILMHWLSVWINTKI